MTSILYVDDEPTIRRAVQLWLRRHGIDVETAASVNDARRLADEQHFDGVFVDVWLEDGSGFDLYYWLCEHHPRLARQTVFVTGDIGASPTLEARLQATGRTYIGKPFDLDELKELAARCAGDGLRPRAREEGPQAGRDAPDG